MQAIQEDLVIIRGGGNKLEINNGVNDIVISLKDENQGSIALTSKPAFQIKINRIDIQQHYICNEVTS